MYYFHIQFKDKNADIYIVRVRSWSRMLNSVTEERAKEKAKKLMVEKLLGVKESDFEIKRATLDNLLRQFVFIENIAQLAVITHP